MKIRIIIFLVNFAAALLLGTSAFGDMPITTDSRIKTVLYSESDIYKLVIHYGYQTAIELSEGEQIQTVSIGDNFAWKITPIGTRLFIKPLQEDIHTNMTLITNQRTYYFDLFASKPTENIEDFTYVMRFFYPEDNSQ